VWTGWIEGGGGGGGGSFQPLDPILTSLSALALTAGDMTYAINATTLAIQPTQSYGRSLLNTADATTARGTLGLGTSATLNASTTSTPNTVVVRDSSGVAAVTALSAASLSPGTTINGVAFNGSSPITVLDSTKLPVNGSAPMTGQLTVNVNAGTTPTAINAQAVLTSGGANPVVLGFSRTGGGASSAALVHTSAGLEVQGATWGSRAPLASGAISVTGAVTASGDVIAFSDLRLKSNITVIDNAVEKINKLRGVTYDRIDTGKRQTGLIAQEVQGILPEAVHESEDQDKTLGIAYGNLAGLFVEAFKEMSARIVSLEETIAELKAQK
jgi:hypothetical protein